MVLSPTKVANQILDNIVGHIINNKFRIAFGESFIAFL